MADALIVAGLLALCGGLLVFLGVALGLDRPRPARGHRRAH